MSQELERVYTINLGKVLLSVDTHRAPRAINMIREFARHHMKTADIRIEEDVAHQIWSKGVRSPPRKIRVRMSKTDEGYVLVSAYSDEKESTDVSDKDAKKGKSSKDSKKGKSSKDAKKGKSSKDSKKDTPVKDVTPDAPVEVKDVPAKVKDTPAKEVKKDTPAKTVKKDTPATTVKKDAPAKVVAKKSK
ncbi:60S ribosomal protein L31-2 [Nitrosarchaeum sp.]|nr:60S ribosomal protein L31-2 [Nitrosarchaeum sp.]